MIDLFYIFQLVLYVVLYTIPVVIIYFVWRHFQKSRRLIEWLKNRQLTIIKISVPKLNEKTPLAAEQMFASLHGILNEKNEFQDNLSFEIVSRDKYIEFYAAIPVHLKDFVESQVYAQYPDVEIATAPDYINSESFRLADGTSLVLASAVLKLNKPAPYPIKTFLNFEVDPLSGITSVLAKLEQSEETWMQVLIRPAPDSWHKQSNVLLSSLRTGSFQKGINWAPNNFIKAFFNLIGLLLKSFLNTGSAAGATGGVGKESGGDKELPASVQSALAGIEAKLIKLGFATQIRLNCLAKNEETARKRLQAVFGAFKQYNTTNLNGFSIGEIAVGPELLSTITNRLLVKGGDIFNIEELASVFHLPNQSVETPNIVWAGSKKGEPPANLPIAGTVIPEELTSFGRTNFRHLTHTFGIKTADRRYHLYAIGKTGTGKSTMLENMIFDDINEDRGLAVVDPHGELINHILDCIPNKRVNDVVYFNPADRDFPVGFNLLESVEPDLRNIVASGVVGIFKKIFGESWGPRLEYILRNTILALLDYPGATMLGIMRMLVDKAFRQEVLHHVKDPVIYDFFVNEFEKYDPKFRTEAIAPIQNKVGQFLSSSTIRNIVGQTTSTIDIAKIMNEGKILLLDLSIGKIGEDNAALLGAMMITKIQLTAMERAGIPEEERRDFYLYVDEFQNFATDSFATILSEARKYRLNLIMTNQYIAQMQEIVEAAVFGNVGTIVSFRIGAADAAKLVKEFEPVFDANDLVNLDNYHIYTKMSIDGVTCPAFSAITLPPKRQVTENKEKATKVSRERHGRARVNVEEKITSTSGDQIKAWEESRAQKKDHYKIIKGEEGKKWFIFDEQFKQSPALVRGEVVEQLPKKIEKQQDVVIKKEELSAPPAAGNKGTGELKELKADEVINLNT